MRPSTRLFVTLTMGAIASCASPECVCPLGQVCDAQGECSGGQCTVDQDCPVWSCAPELECCDPRPTCQSGQCLPRILPLELCGPPPAVADGWDDAPASGPTFVVNQVAIAEGPLVNVDGRCDGAGCLDNAFATVGTLSNDQLRQGLLGGEMLFGIEIAGLDEDYSGFDRSVTVKLYPLRDADDPFFPANNFRTPPGHERCCEFLINPSGLAGSSAPQSRVRIPAQIRNGRLFTVEPIDSAQFELTLGLPPFPSMELALAQFSAKVPSDGSELSDVLFSGVWTSRSLFQTCNPFCRTQTPRCPQPLGEESTLLDLARSIVGDADIDADGDGLECVYDQDGDAAIETCCEGDGALQCPATPCTNPVAATIPGEPSSCAADPGMNDGYSVTFELHAIPATLVGTLP